MQDWKRSLDRYLTQEPLDDSWWFEQCAEHIPEVLYNSIPESVIDKWMERLYMKNYNPEQAARIIVLAIKMRHNII